MANDIFVIVITILLGIPITHLNIITFKNKLKDSYIGTLFIDFIFIFYIIAFVVAACRIVSQL